MRALSLSFNLFKSLSNQDIVAPHKLCFLSARFEEDLASEDTAYGGKGQLLFFSTFSQLGISEKKDLVKQLVNMLGMTLQRENSMRIRFS